MEKMVYSGFELPKTFDFIDEEPGGEEGGGSTTS